MMASWEERKALKPITHAHDNVKELVANFGTVFRDKLSSNSVVTVRGMAAKPEPAKDYKKDSHCPGNGGTELEQQSTVRNLQAEEDLYLLLSFYDTYTYLLLYKNILAIVRQHRTIKYPPYVSE
jgi:hypothetical protein